MGKRWPLNTVVFTPRCCDGLADLQHVVAKTPTPNSLLPEECMGLVGARESPWFEGLRQISRATFLIILEPTLWSRSLSFCGSVKIS